MRIAGSLAIAIANQSLFDACRPRTHEDTVALSGAAREPRRYQGAPRRVRRQRAYSALGRCRRIASAICSPTVNTGLSALSGSWKIIAIRLPRKCLQAPRGALRLAPPHSGGPNPSRSRCAGQDRSLRAGSWICRNLISPTTPRISPSDNVRSTSRTAFRPPGECHGQFSDFKRRSCVRWTLGELSSDFARIK